MGLNQDVFYKVKTAPNIILKGPILICQFQKSYEKLVFVKQKGIFLINIKMGSILNNQMLRRVKRGPVN